MIGIIGAMEEEISVIKDFMSDITEIEVYNNIFYKGRLNNKDVVLVKSGIGMVNASLITTLLINKFDIKRIYFSGVAGSISKNIGVGDVVISTELMEYTFDATAFGYKKGEIPRMETSKFKPKEALEEALEKLKYEKLYFGKIVSGDRFVSNVEEKTEIGKEFDALALDMESAAVAHVATVLGVDFLIIRSISDSLTDDAIMEYKEFVNVAAQNSKNIILKLI